MSVGQLIHPKVSPLKRSIKSERIASNTQIFIRNIKVQSVISRRKVRTINKNVKQSLNEKKTLFTFRTELGAQPITFRNILENAGSYSRFLCHRSHFHAAIAQQPGRVHLGAVKR